LHPLIARAAEAVGSAAADRLRAEGTRMTWGELVAEALTEPAGAGDHPLSRREREIVGLITDGLGNVDIADRLFISKPRSTD
jgi:ATP/maltotriose-dependent transcriptional regulator MalT